MTPDECVVRGVSRGAAAVQLEYGAQVPRDDFLVLGQVDHQALARGRSGDGVGRDEVLAEDPRSRVPSSGHVVLAAHRLLLDVVADESWPRGVVIARHVLVPGSVAPRLDVLSRQSAPRGRES